MKQYPTNSSCMEKASTNFIELFDWVCPLRNIKTYLLKHFWAGPWSTNTFLTTASVENLYKSGCSLPRSLPDNTEIIEILKTGKTGGKMCGCVISSNLIQQVFHLIGFHGTLQNPQKIIFITPRLNLSTQYYLFKWNGCTLVGSSFNFESNIESNRWFFKSDKDNFQYWEKYNSYCS